MASEKSYDERIAELEEKEKKLKAQKKKLKAQKSKEERAQRTHNLIQIGGIVYKVLGREFVDGDVERLAAFLTQQEERGKWFSKAMNNFPTVTEVESTSEKSAIEDAKEEIVSE